MALTHQKEDAWMCARSQIRGPAVPSLGIPSGRGDVNGVRLLTDWGAVDEWPHGVTSMPAAGEGTRLVVRLSTAACVT